MAISRDKKNTLVADMSELLATTKMTVFAKYDGLTVADVQVLRAQAREAGVVIKVIKNRLFRVALGEIDTYEIAPAKILNTFAKTHPAMEIAGGFSGEGLLLSAEDVIALASLPSKAQLIGEVIAMLLSPVHDITNALSGNLHALLDGVEAKATS